MIKLFVCCHKPAPVPDHPLLAPIQVGAALADSRFPGFLYDDKGDNISGKNPSYCELTAQYWAWKNDDSEYVGFFHYRRYLYPHIGERRPYCIAAEPTLSVLEQFDFSRFEALVPQYDLLAPIGENMRVTVRDHYAAAPFHHGEDLDLAVRILDSLHPEYHDAAAAYLAGTTAYFGNIYIMRRTVFESYCAWLFPILDDFDRQCDTSGWKMPEQRVDGYIAERLFGIYYTYHRLRGDLRTAELPRLHFDGGAGLDAFTRRILYYMLPPGTRRRAILKGVVRPWRGLM